MNPAAALANAQTDPVRARAGMPAPACGSLGLVNAPSPRNILVFQLARLGDLVQTWPLLTRLRQAYPGARLTLLADQRLLPLQAAGPRMDEVLGLDLLGMASRVKGDWPGAYHFVEDFLQDLRAREFDLVFNLNFSRLSLLLTHLLGAPAKGYLPAAGGREFSREPWLSWICSMVHARRFNRFHLTDVFRHLAPEPEAAPPLPRLATPPRGEPLIALQLATRHKRRTWPLEHFTRLTEDLVTRQQARVLLLGTKAERVLGERLRAALPAAIRERVQNLQGSTGLAELVNQLRQAHLLVSGDTGTLHLAAALDVPTVALFLGPAQCFETGPYGEGHFVLQAEPPCHPCLEAASTCPEEGPICLEMLPPLAVSEIISGLLEAGTAPPEVSLPVGSRLYRSGFDALGVRYQYLGEEPPHFVDLVGQAYRQVGAWLVEQGRNGGQGLAPAGQPVLSPPAAFPQLSLPTAYGERKNLAAADLKALEWLFATLKQGSPLPLELPNATEALWPLMAFRTEMADRGNLALYYQAADVFAAQLESWLSKMR